MLFTSDNWAGVHPKIMDAMVAANRGSVPAYGADDITRAAFDRFRDLFGAEVEVAFVATGSAANSLALACAVPPWGAVLCHRDAHIHVDECGAPEFYTGGAKLVPVDGEHGKLTPEAVDAAMRFFIPQQTHRVVPGALSLTQGTEAGTVYTSAEIAALGETAKRYGLKLHMDGARFANACAHLGCAPREMVTETGVDVLTLGGTKNGCMVAEAIVMLDGGIAGTLPQRQKRAGHGLSKNRFLAAQWNAYLTDDLWLELAGSANDAAAALGWGLTDRGVHLAHPVEINEVFPILSDAAVSGLKEAGAQFYDWVQPGDPFDGKLRRLVTSYATTDEDVTRFLDACDARSLGGQNP